MDKNPNISYLGALLNIAEYDPKMALVFTRSDIAFAKDELVSMRTEIQAARDAASAAMADRDKMRAALDEILNIPNCTYGPAWQMQGIARKASS